MLRECLVLTCHIHALRGHRSIIHSAKLAEAGKPCGKMWCERPFVRSAGPAGAINRHEWVKSLEHVRYDVKWGSRSLFFAPHHPYTPITFHRPTTHRRDMSVTHSKKPARLLAPGIYAPLPTFFLDNDEQDLGKFPKPTLRSM